MELNHMNPEIFQAFESNKPPETATKPPKRCPVRVALRDSVSHTASSQAFAVVELLDSVLSHLANDPVTLARAQQVNSVWYDLIKKGYSVQQFLEPQQHRRYAYYQKLDDQKPQILYILDDVFPPWPEDVLCLDLIRTHPILKGKMVKDKDNPSGFHDEFVYPNFSIIPTKKDHGERGGIPDDRVYRVQRSMYELDDLLLARLPRGGAWEQILAFQPPVCEIRMQMDAEGAGPRLQNFIGNQYGVKCEAEPGVTLGQLRDRIEKEITKAQKRKTTITLKTIWLIKFETLIVGSA